MALFLEATFVGATLIPVYGAVCQAMDSLYPETETNKEVRWMMKVWATGYLYHMGAEFVGMNDWFLRNSVAQKKVERDETERMSERRAERYNYSNYAVPQFPDADVRLPGNDKWAQGSWTGAPGAPASNSVASRN